MIESRMANAVTRVVHRCEEAAESLRLGNVSCSCTAMTYGAIAMNVYRVVSLGRERARDVSHHFRRISRAARLAAGGDWSSAKPAKFKINSTHRFECWIFTYTCNRLSVLLSIVQNRTYTEHY